jgi:hypothetical protein
MIYLFWRRASAPSQAGLSLRFIGGDIRLVLIAWKIAMSPS